VEGVNASLRPLVLASTLVAFALAACGGNAVMTQGAGSAGSGGSASCPAPNPGQCIPSLDCVGGVVHTGQASCVNGQWVCGTAACEAGAGGCAATDSGQGGRGAGGSCVVLRADAYSTSCADAVDCVPVYLGSTCAPCRCPNGAIAQSDQAKYAADLEAAGPAPGMCGCPAYPPLICPGGKCVLPPP
jgi:hypothetical protein